MPRLLSSLRRPLMAFAAVATATTVVYASRRQTNNSLDAPPLVPLQRDSHGRPVPPTFPRIKSRAENLAELRRHGRQHQTHDTNNDNDNDHDDDDDESIYDLLVIGGGATGAGIALDAVTRGLRVALVERDDFSAGTSSRSTKLVHGGVRYLEKATKSLSVPQLRLVTEALRERRTFLDIAPHLSAALPILLPLESWPQALRMWLGLKAYDLLAGGGGGGLEPSRYVTHAAARAALPMLDANRFVGALVYYDGQHNDARMNVALAMTASLHGATVLNHVEVTGLDKDAATGNICGARVRDLLSADGTQAFHVRARGVINATGPFADAVERMDDPQRKAIIAPASGAHVVLPGSLCPNGMGILDAASSDGRVVFVLPWQGHTLAGTTDSACKVERQPVARDDDVDFILREVNKLLKPGSALTRADVLATWSGIRPLVKNPNAKNTESMVRSHLVTVSPSNLLTCVGGKWTTYRQMAEDAVDEAIKTFGLKPRVGTPLANVSGVPIAPQNSSSSSSNSTDTTITTGACITRHVVLTGSHGYSARLASKLAQSHGLDADIAQHLANNYGDRAWALLSTKPPPTSATNAGADTDATITTTTTTTTTTVTRLLPSHPFTDAEVRYGIRAEAACTAADVIARRTRLAFLDVDAALLALPQVIAIMTQELGWSAARQAREWHETVHFLESMGMGLSPKPLLPIAADDATPVISGETCKAVTSREKKALAVGDGNLEFEAGQREKAGQS